MSVDVLWPFLNIYIYYTMRYLFGIYKELIKCGLQRNSDTIVFIAVYMVVAQYWVSQNIAEYG